jgi:hypothetical protein
LTRNRLPNPGKFNRLSETGAKEPQKKRDVAWREYDKAAKMIEHQKDELLDTVEERLKQTVAEKTSLRCSGLV